MKEIYFGQVRAKEIADKLRKFKPRIAFVLGSGWGGTVDYLNDVKTVSYKSLGMAPCGVEGHKGQFVFGTLHGVSVMIQQGRYHMYEGRDIAEIILPIAIMKELGTETLILTNAAGAVNARYTVGDLIFISDHINFTGKNPLIGVKPNQEYPVFVDLSNVYDCKIYEAMQKSATEQGIRSDKGIYLQVSGPSFETPAEIKMYRTMGADLVGMSTVLEAIYAKYLHLKVGAVSCVTNMAAGMTNQEINHADVLNQSLMREKTMSQFLSDFIKYYK